jgi:hypothetical protein
MKKRLMAAAEILHCNITGAPCGFGAPARHQGAGWVDQGSP